MNAKKTKMIFNRWNILINANLYSNKTPLLMLTYIAIRRHFNANLCSNKTPLLMLTYITIRRHY